MAHYQYQIFTGWSWAEQVYTSASLLTPPTNPTDTTKPAVAYSITTREIDWYRDTVSLVWRKAFNMDVLATITPTASTWTVATTQDTARIANWTVPTASATYEWVILEVSWLATPILPTSWPLLNTGELSNWDMIICENSNWIRQWKKLADKWWNEHLLSGTRTVIIGLRNTWLLIPWRSYEITDHVQWRLVTWTTVTLLATSATELSQDARVNSTYDNTSWFWLYDIDTAIVYELHDTRNNIARWLSWTEVANFDWWNTAYTNVVVDNSTLTVTYWNTALITNVTVEKGSSVNLTWFTWTITNSLFTIVAVANFTWSNWTWRYMVIKDNGSFNISWYTWGWDNYYNTISSSSAINFSNTSSLIIFRNNTIQGTVINNTWVSTGSFTLNNSVTENGNITHSAGAGSFTSSQLSLWQASSISHTTWTLALTRVILDQSWTININTNIATTNIIDATIKSSSQITNSSITSLTLSRVVVESISNIIAATGSGWTMSITDTRLFGSGSIQKLAGSTAWALTINGGTEVDSSAFIYHNGTGNLTVTWSTLYGSSRIYVTTWNRNYAVLRLTGRNVAQITLNWTGAGITDNINDVDIDSRWQINMSATGATSNAIQYSSIKWLSGTINVTGTSASQTIQRCKAYDAPIQVINCTIAMTHDLNFASDSGTLTIQNLAVAKPVTYVHTQSWASISITGTVVWWVSRLNASSNWQIVVSWVTWTVNAVDVSEWIVNINWWASHSNITKRMNSTLTTGNFTTNNIIHITNVNKTMTANNAARSDILWVVSSVPII